MTLPNIALPPGYRWVEGPMNGRIAGAPSIVDSTGRPAGYPVGDYQGGADALWERYNQATAGSGAAPGTTLTLQQLSSIGNLEEGTRVANEQALSSLEGEYAGIPDALRNSYGNAARRAGTWGNTDEFAAGLESEVRGGTRGARTLLHGRINALRSALGREAFVDPEFTPDPITNNTGDNEGSAISDTDSGAAPVGDNDDEGSSAPNAVQSLITARAQNPGFGQLGSTQTISQPASANEGTGDGPSTLGPTPQTAAREASPAVKQTQDNPVKKDPSVNLAKARRINIPGRPKAGRIR